MLETIREYAGERLEESDATEETRQRHAEWFLALAEECEPAPMATLEESTISRLLAELDNLRAAIDFVSTLPDSSGELRLVGTLFRFWEASGLVVEGRRTAERALARGSGESDPRLRVNVLYGASMCAGHQGDWEDAMSWDRERLRIARALEDTELVAVALNDVGICEVSMGDLVTGVALFEGSRALASRIGESQIVASATNNLADAALTRRDFANARALAEEALALTNPGDSWRVHPESNLAYALLGLGEIELAGQKFRDTIEVVRRVLGPVYTVMTLDGLAAVAAARREFGRAACLFGAAREIRVRGGFHAYEFEQGLAEKTERAGRDALGDEQWELEWAQGAKMTLDEAVTYARELPDA
jgi:tetratricopeptide (TPR) repeat protein